MLWNKWGAIEKTKKNKVRQQVGRATRTNPNVNARDSEKTVGRYGRRHGSYAVRTKKKGELRGSYGIIISVL